MAASCASRCSISASTSSSTAPPTTNCSDRVRRDGDWEAWLAFFLDGVQQVADGAVSTAERLGEMFQNDRARIEATGRRAGSALARPRGAEGAADPVPAGRSRHDRLSFPAVSSAMELLVELGVARELTGKRRNRLFVYDRYLAILNEGTEPL